MRSTLQIAQHKRRSHLGRSAGGRSAPAGSSNQRAQEELIFSNHKRCGKNVFEASCGSALTFLKLILLFEKFPGSRLSNTSKILFLGRNRRAIQ